MKFNLREFIMSMINHDEVCIYSKRRRNNVAIVGSADWSIFFPFGLADT